MFNKKILETLIWLTFVFIFFFRFEGYFGTLKT